MVARSHMKMLSFQFGRCNQKGDYSHGTYIIECVKLINSIEIVIFLGTKYINGTDHIENFIN